MSTQTSLPIATVGKNKLTLYQLQLSLKYMCVSLNRFKPLNILVYVMPGVNLLSYVVGDPVEKVC